MQPYAKKLKFDLEYFQKCCLELHNDIKQIKKRILQNEYHPTAYIRFLKKTLNHWVDELNAWEQEYEEKMRDE